MAMVFLTVGVQFSPVSAYAAGAGGSPGNGSPGCNSGCAVVTPATRIHTPRGHPQLDKPASIAPLSPAQFGLGMQTLIGRSTGLRERQSAVLAAGGTMMLDGMVAVVPELLDTPHGGITVVK